MAAVAPTPPPLRFGLYELDPVRWELRRSGILIGLQQQPCRLLHLLASHAGQVMNREEIRRYLWPEEVAGDFDTRINFCLTRIRDALQDDAANPRFIKTVRGQGYCFLAPLIHPPVAEPALEPAMVAPVHSRKHLLVAAGLLMVGALGGLAWWRGRALPQPPSRVTHSDILVMSPNPIVGSLVVAGGYVFYTTLAPSGQSLFRISQDGGAPTPIPASPSLLSLLAASPDARDLVLGLDAHNDDDTRTWLLPAAGGIARPFGAVRGPHVAWRPDGRAVAYSFQNSVWLANAQGAQVRRLATVSGLALASAWSADGRHLAFASANRRVGSSALWEVAGGGGRPQRLIALPGLDSIDQVAWSRDQRFLVFSATRRSDNLSEILALSLPPDRGRARISVLFASTPNADLLGTAIDAHGRVLVTGPLGDSVNVVRFDRARSAFTPFLADARDVNYSRDGARIAYIRVSDNSLWVARPDGSQARELAGPPLQAMLPHWSPDGSLLAFDGLMPGANWRLYLIGSDGHGLEPLPDPEAANGQGGPTWSPDGQALVYADVLCGAPRNCGVHRLDLRTRAVAALPGSAGLRTARWSPDGRWVAALDTQTRDIMLYDLDHPGSPWRRLWTHPVDDYLEWSADSRSLYFVASGTDVAEVERLPLPQGLPVPVATFRAPTPHEGYPFAWFGLGPGDTPLLGYITASPEILALTWSPR